MWNAFIGFFVTILEWLTNLTGNLGSAIILFTIGTRVAMLPLTLRQLRSSKRMQELQPLMAQLRRKYGKDQQRFAQEMTKVYKQYKVNPAGGCLPLLLQMPIFLGVYQAIARMVTTNTLPASFISFGWIPNLSLNDPLYILPIVTIVLQLLVSVMAMPKIQDPQQKVTSQAMLILPVVMGILWINFNAGAVLNWATGAVVSLIQQFFVTGWGSLTNYLPWLPAFNGFLLPTPIAVSDDDDVVEAEVVPQGKPDFWAPLQKLQTASAGITDDATERAITEVKNQGRPGKRR